MPSNRSDGAETRGRLLAAAGAVFAAKGYHLATTAEICRKADANTAAVNYHFHSKEQLYAEAWRHAYERSIRVHPPDGGVPASASAEERLRGQIRALVHRTMDPHSIEFDIAQKEMGSPTGLLAEVMRRSIEPWRERFTGLVRELLGSRASEEQVELCAMSINAQCFGPLMRRRQRRACVAGGKSPDRARAPIEADVLADHVFQFSLAGLRAAGEHSEGRRTRPITREATA